MRYPGDGQKAMGYVFFLLLIGPVISFIYFIAGTVFQLLTRRQPLYYPILFDSLVFLFLAGLLMYAGITAEYVDHK